MGGEIGLQRGDVSANEAARQPEKLYVVLDRPYILAAEYLIDGVYEVHKGTF